jgi:phospholipid/cholesterol/gamma-HCH transport system ATP-binding protein
MGVLINLIARLNRALGHTSIIVSHDIQETLSIADYVYLIADGKVLAQGRPDELSSSEDERVLQFMKGQPDGPVPFHYPAPNFMTQLLGE